MLAVPNGNRFDFYPRWVGAREAVGGGSPYSEEVAVRVQEGMFGRVLDPAEDPPRFTYFPLLIWLLLPLWLAPFPVAVSLWCGLQLLILILLFPVVASILRWRPSPLSLAIVVLASTLVYRYPINAYLLGQFIPLCMACLVAAWWGLSAGRPTLVGLSLLMALIRPEVVVLPLAALLFLAWKMKYRSAVFLWAVGVAALWLLTRIWIGPWEDDFLSGLALYQAQSSPVWPPGLLGNPLAAMLALVAVGGWAIWLWTQVSSLERREQIGWILSLTTILGLMVLPQTGSYTLMLGLFPVWMYLWVSAPSRARTLIGLLVLALPWLLMLGGRGVLAIEHLAIPTALGLLLTLAWWFRKGSLPAASPAQRGRARLEGADRG